MCSIVVWGLTFLVCRFLWKLSNPKTFMWFFGTMAAMLAAIAAFIYVDDKKAAAAKLAYYAGKVKL